MLLYKTFWPDIQADEGLLDEYLTELKLTWVTRRMIARGVELRIDDTIKLIDKLEVDIAQVLQTIHDMVGRPINPRSPKDMHPLLFEELGLPIIKRSDKTGKPSMDKEVFETWEQDPEVEHPVLDMVLQYRSYTHSLPIIKSYLRLADADNIIHPGILPLLRRR